MISVIVCSRQPPSAVRHSQNVARTVGCPHEYIRIDNRGNTFSLCGAYNRGVRESHGDILVFVHEDVFFLCENWGVTLAGKFAADAALGVVGVAGGQYLDHRAPGWCVVGRPFIHGKVVHELDGRLILSVYSWMRGDVEVAAVDGLFFAVRASLFERIRFDDATFDGFHFYDLDICMQARATHKVVVTDDIFVKHLSEGSFDQVWIRYAERFVEKYRAQLPVNCTSIQPDFNRITKFESFDVTTRLAAIKEI